MLRKTFALLLGAVTLGLVTPKSASAQASPPPEPTAVKAALLAYDLFHHKVEYRPEGVDGIVVVTLFGPPAPEMPDQIFRVVWATEPLRFSDVVVTWPGGEVRRSYGELAASLGPRPAGFDKTTVNAALMWSGLGSWDGFIEPFKGLTRVLWAAVIAVCIAVTMVVVSFVLAVGAAISVRRLRSLSN